MSTISLPQVGTVARTVEVLQSTNGHVCKVTVPDAVKAVKGAFSQDVTDNKAGMTPFLTLLADVYIGAEGAAERYKAAFGVSRAFTRVEFKAQKEKMAGWVYTEVMALVAERL